MNKKMTSLELLRNLTERLPSLMEAATPSADGTEVLIDGWTIPYRGVFNQANCGICHARAVRGDHQPSFRSKEKMIFIVIRGVMEFTTVSPCAMCAQKTVEHILGAGDVTEIPPPSDFESIFYKDDVEFLFITIPRWEGTPLVKRVDK